jgi:hypothetical protein
LNNQSEQEYCEPIAERRDRHTRLRSAAGWSIIAISCALAYAAHTVSPLLWPVVAVVAWFGAYQTVYARGCGLGDVRSTPTGGQLEGFDRLPASARATRLRMGLGFLLLSVLPAALALWGWALLWPLAFLAWWFAASFLVAATTGYRGCPEVGAIPSLLMRCDIPTRCRPMERIDRLRDGEA